MIDLRDLYQEVILDHNRHPRNFREMGSANRTAEGYNPLCGDKVTLYLHVDEEGVISDISFTGAGCAISTAAASLMTEVLVGHTVEQATEVFESFRRLITCGLDSPGVEELGKLAVFSGVREFPARVKCATLCWHTMKAALESCPETVTTE